MMDLIIGDSQLLKKSRNPTHVSALFLQLNEEGGGGATL